MKFKKDGKVYDLTEMRIEVCDKAKSCERCRAMIAAKAFDIPCPTIWNRFPRGTAALCGFEVVEDDPGTAETTAKHSEDVKRDIREVVEKCGEGVKPDPVNRPAHYTSGGIECIDAMQAAFGDEAVKDFCLCNAFKYLWRHRNKNGVEDLKKARWYLNRLIEEVEE